MVELIEIRDIPARKDQGDVDKDAYYHCVDVALGRRGRENLTYCEWKAQCDKCNRQST